MVNILKAAGFECKHGANHDIFFKGFLRSPVKRHREIEDQIAKRILRQVGLR